MMYEVVQHGYVAIQSTRLNSGDAFSDTFNESTTFMA